MGKRDYNELDLPLDTIKKDAYAKGYAAGRKAGYTEASRAIHCMLNVQPNQLWSVFDGHGDVSLILKSYSMSDIIERLVKGGLLYK